MKFNCHIRGGGGKAGKPVIQPHRAFNNGDFRNGAAGNFRPGQDKPGMKKKLTRGVAGKFLPRLHPWVEIQGRKPARGGMPAGIDEVRARFERAHEKTSVPACGHKRKRNGSRAADQHGRKMRRGAGTCHDRSGVRYCDGAAIRPAERGPCRGGPGRSVPETPRNIRNDRSGVRHIRRK